MKTTNTKIIDKAGLAIIQDRKVLLVREHGMNVWFIPGGRLKDGEDFIKALVRETREELSVDLDESSLLLLGIYRDVAAGRVNTDVEIHLYSGSVSGDYTPSSEIAELGWFDSKSDPKILSDIVKNKLIPALHTSGLID